MNRPSILLSFRRISCIALLGACLPAAGATLDLVADAVLGKATFTSPAGGTASATSIVKPLDVAQDPVSGELWVADFSANRVLRFASAAAFANGEAANLVLGQADFTASLANRGGPVAANTLYFPRAMAVDQSGRLYVTDSNNSRVLVYRPPFSSGMDAAWVIGQADFTSGLQNRGGSVAANSLRFPRNLVLDSRGNLYVADLFNNRVLKFDGPAVTGASASKVFGQGGSFTTAAAATTATGMSWPSGLAIDAADNLWVAEQGNIRVVRFDAGAAAGDASADLVLCQANFTSSGFGTTASSCQLPMGVAVDHAGVVYVADYDNSRVLRYTTLSNGAAATAVIGQADFTGSECNRGGTSPSASTLCRPFGIVLDRDGNLLVADSDNDRVLRYDLPRARADPAIATISPESMPQGGGTFTLTVNGSRFYGNSVVNLNGSPRATQFLSHRRLVAQIPAADIAASGPFAVTVATAGPGGGTSSLLNLQSYARAPLDGVADLVLGQPGFAAAVPLNPQVGEETLGSVNAANQATFAGAHVAVDPASGRLFVADLHANRVRSWPSVAALHNAQSADVILGQPDEFTQTCNTGGVGAATLCEPYGLAFDASGALYVSDRANNRVLRYAPPFSTGMAATRVFGQGGSYTTRVSNNGGLSANSLALPLGIAVSASALFVHDAANQRVLVYDNPTADFTADVVIGQANMTTAAGGPASSTSIGASDSGLAFDGEGRLHVSNCGGNRILRFPLPFVNGMAADLVLGQADFSSVAAAVTASGLHCPIGIAFDPAGNLLGVDFYNHRVLRYAAPLESAMPATGILGQTDFVTNTPGTTATKFSLPLGLAIDAVGNLFVSEFENPRVLAFDRPFAFVLDPAKDLDRDGIPNGVEVTESRDPYVKDNDVFANARLFAMQQYRDFLSREGDPAGISGWTGLVTGGAYSRLQVIDSFLLSDEFAGVIAPVVRLYFATFLRVPDFAGLTFNAGLVRNGTVSLVQLADFFTASPEFAATYGSLTNAQFVTLLYGNVLGRAPDQAGLDGWVSLLNGGYTRGQVLLGFSDSVEYQANMANEVFVTMMYAGMLRRTPEPTGFNGWVAFLDAATYTREQVINGFFLSNEYRARFLP